MACIKPLYIEQTLRYHVSGVTFICYYLLLFEDSKEHFISLIFIMQPVNFKRDMT